MDGNVNPGENGHKPEREDLSMVDESKIGPDEASRAVKRHAEGNRIEIKLTEEQMSAILERWNDRDPKMPAEITFFVEERPISELKVAGYRYTGDICCA